MEAQRLEVHVFIGRASIRVHLRPSADKTLLSGSNDAPKTRAIFGDRPNFPENCKGTTAVRIQDGWTGRAINDCIFALI
jgi:hypothetical protein